MRSVEDLRQRRTVLLDRARHCLRDFEPLCEAPATIRAIAALLEVLETVVDELAELPVLVPGSAEQLRRDIDRAVATPEVRGVMSRICDAITVQNITGEQYEELCLAADARCNELEKRNP